MDYKRHKSASFSKKKPLPIDKSVGAIVVSPTGRYLLLDRVAIKEGPVIGHYWEFSKGHKEGEESEMETLMREIEEECGIRSFEIIRGFRAKYEYLSTRGFRRLFVMYLIRTGDEKVWISEEHKTYKWAGFEEAKSLLHAPQWVRMLMNADEYLKANF